MKRIVGQLFFPAFKKDTSTGGMAFASISPQVLLQRQLFIQLIIDL